MIKIKQAVKTKSEMADHRFLDEAGDTTFWGKGKIPIIGLQDGVSLSFTIGMLKFKQPLQPIRDEIIRLQKQVMSDTYFKDIPSIQKKINKAGYFFHAKDDIPEVRKIFYDFIKTINVSFEAVVGRKIYEIFSKKHNSKANEFYADLLSHLLKNKFNLGGKLVLNIAERGSSTKNKNLVLALEKAKSRFNKKNSNDSIRTNIVFNIQNQTKEPLLNISDYMCWSIQRVFEKGETRYYNFISDKVSLICDLYDQSKYEGHLNFYRRDNKLTAQNKLSPP